jgi:hypothetical protein
MSGMTGASETWSPLFTYTDDKGYYQIDGVPDCPLVVSSNRNELDSVALDGDNNNIITP